VVGSLEVAGGITFTDDLSIGKNADIGQHLLVTGDASLNSKLYVSNSVAIGKASVDAGITLDVNGYIQCTGIKVGSGGATDSSGLIVEEIIRANGGIAVPSGDSIVNDGTTILNGAATLTGGLSVTGGDASVSNRLIVTGDSSFNNNLTIANDLNVKRNLKVEHDTSLNGYLTVANDASFNNNLQVTNKVISSTIKTTTSADIADLRISGNTISTVGGNGNINIAPTSGKKVHITGGLVVDGSINFTGDFIRTDTKVEVTTQFDISNNGTGPALKVTQYGANHIATFYDDENVAFQIADDGLIGIGMLVPTVQLDVSGDVKISKTLNIVGNLSSTDGNVLLTNGNITLTNGRVTANNLTVTTDATIGGNATVTNGNLTISNGNLSMETAGYINQW
jgi:predicted acyltransferase (DUF342 family)